MRALWKEWHLNLKYSFQSDYSFKSIRAAMTEMLKVYSGTKISFLSGAEILNVKVGKRPRKSISTRLEGFEYSIPKEFGFF